MMSWYLPWPKIWRGICWRLGAGIDSKWREMTGRGAMGDSVMMTCMYVCMYVCSIRLWNVASPMVSPRDFLGKQGTMHVGER